MIYNDRLQKFGEESQAALESIIKKHGVIIIDESAESEMLQFRYYLRGISIMCMPTKIDWNDGEVIVYAESINSERRVEALLGDLSYEEIANYADYFCELFPEILRLQKQ